MKTRLVAVFILLAVVDIAPRLATAQSEFPYSVRLSLHVEADDSIKNQVVSFASRGLRALNGVLLVEKDADWHLNIVAMAVRTRGGTPVGHVVTTAVLRALGNREALQTLAAVLALGQQFRPFEQRWDSLPELVNRAKNWVASSDQAEKIPQGAKETWIAFKAKGDLDAALASIKVLLASASVRPYSYLADHIVLVASDSDLEALCRRTVASFDSRHLELDRKAHQEFTERLRKR